MELNQSLPDVEAKGVRLAVITPDPVATLRTFSDRHHIAYPMLADLGGRVIDRFGVRNPNIPDDHPVQRPGTPFPGHMLIGPDARIRDKAFTGDLRYRPSATALVLAHFGPGGQRGVEVRTDEVNAEIVVSTTRVFPGQEIALSAEVRVAPGWHVYGADVAQPYTGLGIELPSGANPLLEHASMTAPPAEVLELAAIGERLPVHHGTVTLAGTLRIRWSPPPTRFEGIHDVVASLTVPPGDYELSGELRYQACSGTECLAPRSVPFTIPLTLQDHVAT